MLYVHKIIPGENYDLAKDLPLIIAHYEQSRYQEEEEAWWQAHKHRITPYAPCCVALLAEEGGQEEA